MAPVGRFGRQTGGVPAAGEPALGRRHPRAGLPAQLLNGTLADRPALLAQERGDPPVAGARVLLRELLGTAMAAAGVAALNQMLEADVGALMRCTHNRPIPAGTVTTGSAFVLGGGLCAGGLALLFAAVNGLSALFALATMVCYLAIYTPAKR
jgi:heme O synthase-like polyprenyltransferase